MDARLSAGRAVTIGRYDAARVGMGEAAHLIDDPVRGVGRVQQCDVPKFQRIDRQPVRDRVVVDARRQAEGEVGPDVGGSDEYRTEAAAARVDSGRRRALGRAAASAVRRVS
ncbi:hypothetical protein [Micromonospora echinaurantiaca]|uniref:hypothetical protein n=1 Tax=Micromonospora echinaurantiaca TaxID=47857 RepID=UPI0034134B2F